MYSGKTCRCIDVLEEICMASRREIELDVKSESLQTRSCECCVSSNKLLLLILTHI